MRADIIGGTLIGRPARLCHWASHFFGYDGGRQLEQLLQVPAVATGQPAV